MARLSLFTSKIDYMEELALRPMSFLSDRLAPMVESPAGKKQIYGMPAAGGEAHQLTKMENGVTAFQGEADSVHLSFAAEASESKAMKERKENLGEYHVAHADYTVVHIWLTEMPKANLGCVTQIAPPPRLLMPGQAFTVAEFAFVPDGT